MSVSWYKGNYILMLRRLYKASGPNIFGSQHNSSFVIVIDKDKSDSYFFFSFAFDVVLSLGKCERNK